MSASLVDYEALKQYYHYLLVVHIILSNALFGFEAQLPWHVALKLEDFAQLTFSRSNFLPLASS